jgi:protein-disulfide isomerase
MRTLPLPTQRSPLRLTQRTLLQLTQRSLLLLTQRSLLLLTQRSLLLLTQRSLLRRAGALALAALAACALLAPPALAQQFTPAQRAEIVSIMRDALLRDPSILHDAIQSMKDADMRTTIEAHRAELVMSSDPVAGNANGTVTVVEFYDTRCPYCREIEPTMAHLLAQDHRVRLVYKDLPVLGPASVLAAHALLAAQRQNGYDKLRAALMQAPPDYTKDEVLAIARKVGLDADRLARDMNDKTIAARLDANLALASALGIDGTPALVVGDVLIPGAIEYSELEKEIGAARAQ